MKSVKQASNESLINKQAFNCQACQDIGWVYKDLPWGKPGFGKAYRCICKVEEDKKREAEIYVRMCGLPTETKHMTLAGFKMKNGLQSVKRDAELVANEEGNLKWLTILADNDLGKTHLGIAICRRWLDRGRPAKYAYVPLLLDELRKGFELEGEASYSARFEFYCNVPLLMLDDLGVESTSPWVNEKLDTILDYRLMNGLYLVVTTNLPLDEIPRRLSSRLTRGRFSKVNVVSANPYKATKAW